MPILTPTKTDADLPVEAPAYNITKIVTGFLAIATPAAVPLLIHQFGVKTAKENPAVAVAVAGIVVSAIFAVAIMVAADVKARAYAAAGPGSAGLDTSPAAGAGMAGLFPMAAKTKDEGQDRVAVFSLRWDAKENKTWYLTAEPGKRAHWIPEEDVTELFFEHNLLDFFPKS
jgi:hypothetical protein